MALGQQNSISDLRGMPKKKKKDVGKVGILSLVTYTVGWTL